MATRLVWCAWFVTVLLASAARCADSVPGTELLQIRVGEFGPVLAVRTRPGGEVTVFRDELVHYLRQRISITDRGSTPAASEGEKAALRTRVEGVLDTSSKLALPPTLTAPDELTFRSILGTNMLVFSADLAEIQKRVEDWLHGIAGKFAFSRYVVPPAGHDREALENQIDLVVDEMRKALTEHLAKWVPEAEIGAYCSEMRDNMRNRVLDRSTYAFKAPASGADIESIVRELQRRVSDSIGKVGRFAAATEGKTGQRDQAGGSKAALISMSGAVRVVGLMAKVTVDPTWVQYEAVLDSRRKESHGTQSAEPPAGADPAKTGPVQP
jgi:hypothetical protein